MNTSSNDNDKELHAYLEGRDGVSETYRKLGQPEPPDHLDALILARARAGNTLATDQKPVSGYFSGRFAVAASLVTGILVGSLVFGTGLLQFPTDSGQAAYDAAESSLTESFLKNTAVSGTVNTGPPSAIQAEAPQAEAPQFFDRAERQLVPAGNRLETETRRTDNQSPVIVTGSRTRAQPAPGDIELVRAASNSESTATSSAMLPAAPAGITDSDQRGPLVMDEVEVTANGTGSSLVTGADFRLSPETWAEEIYYLSLEASDLANMLESEKQLFRQRFPEADLDALLARTEEGIIE